MNAVEMALIELRADMARNPGGLDDAELAAMLAEVVEESDASVRATVEFFGLNMEAIEERAAAMQYDGGAARVATNRLALTVELQRTMPSMSDAMCRWFAQNMATVTVYAQKHDMSRDELAEELRAYFRQNPTARTNNSEAIHGQAI